MFEPERKGVDAVGLVDAADRAQQSTLKWSTRVGMGGAP